MTPLHESFGPFLYANDASDSIVDYLNPGMFAGACFERIATTARTQAAQGKLNVGATKDVCSNRIIGCAID